MRGGAPPRMGDSYEKTRCVWNRERQDENKPHVILCIPEIIDSSFIIYLQDFDLSTCWPGLFLSLKTPLSSPEGWPGKGEALADSGFRTPPVSGQCFAPTTSRRCNSPVSRIEHLGGELLYCFTISPAFSATLSRGSASPGRSGCNPPGKAAPGCRRRCKVSRPDGQIRQRGLRLTKELRDRAAG